MIIQLCALPSTLRGPADDGYNGRLPTRARFMAPRAARSLFSMANRYRWLTMTDIYRSPEASMAARKTKRGVKPPGFSGHNFGESIDGDVDACLREGRMSYAELLDIMAAEGWYCHRRDRGQGAESWHFNYFGDEAARLLTYAERNTPSTWDDPLERKLVELHGAAWDYGTIELQAYLNRLHFYRGELDGSSGPLTREAIAAFQRAWGLVDDGLAGPRTRRVLAVVAATIEMVPL